MSKRFRTKELMISVLGEEESRTFKCGVNFSTCFGGTCFGGTDLCFHRTIACQIGRTLQPCDFFSRDPCLLSRGCGANFSTCLGTFFELTPHTPVVQAGDFESLEDIQSLREDLQATLKELDTLEEQFQSDNARREAADLEEKLESALQEVRRKREKLG